MINSRVIFLMRVETKVTVRVSENSAQAREKLVLVVNTGTSSSVHTTCSISFEMNGD